MTNEALNNATAAMKRVLHEATIDQSVKSLEKVYPFLAQEYQTAIDWLIDVQDGKIPGTDGTHRYCPTCGQYFGKQHPHCWNCGQKLEWTKDGANNAIN